MMSIKNRSFRFVVLQVSLLLLPVVSAFFVSSCRMAPKDNPGDTVASSQFYPPDTAQLHRQRQADSAVVAQQPAVSAPVQASADENTGSKLSYQEHKEQQKKIRKAQRAVEEAEKKIASLEARIKELDDLLMDPKNASNMELVNEYTATQAALDRENNQWMELSEALESLG